MEEGRAATECDKWNESQKALIRKHWRMCSTIELPRCCSSPLFNLERRNSMASPEPEVFSGAQQEWIRQLIEANRPPPPSTPTTSSSTSQVLPTATTTATTTSTTPSTAGNLGKLCYAVVEWVKGKGPRA